MAGRCSQHGTNRPGMPASFSAMHLAKHALLLVISATATSAMESPTLSAEVQTPPPPTKTEVKSLPGVAQLPNKIFTGYIDAGTPPSGVGTMYFHYWCVMSARNASSDPVIFWYNGGPGASSLFGVLQEFGPLLLNVDSYDVDYGETSIPTPQANAWAWTAQHTVCALDSPPPMGFSFCSQEGPGGSPTSCGPWSDKTVFAANHKAHVAFYEKIFPELKSNPTYFAGESYAGLYVPGFVEAMMDDPVPGLNLKGFAIGDGFPGCEVRPDKPVDWCLGLDNVGIFEYPNALPGPYWDVEFFHGRSQMSEELYNRIQKTCTKAELRGVRMPLSLQCKLLMTEMSEEVGYFYAYNVFNACPPDSPAAKVSKHGANRAARARAAVPGVPVPGDGDGGVGSACLGNVMSEWLLHPATLTAIGAPQGSKFINLDNGHGFNYTTDRSFVGDVYEKAIKRNMSVLIYEGDLDACGLGTQPTEEIFVPLFDSLVKRTQLWRPWGVPGSTALGGYNIDWDGGRVRFVSLRGAGHMGPTDRPAAAYTMMNAFTDGSGLPAPPKPAMSMRSQKRQKHAADIVV